MGIQAPWPGAFEIDSTDREAKQTARRTGTDRQAQTTNLLQYVDREEPDRVWPIYPCQNPGPLSRVSGGDGRRAVGTCPGRWTNAGAVGKGRPQTGGA